MKHSLEEAVRWQYSEVEQDFDTQREIEELEAILKLPISKRDLEESDIEITDEIGFQKNKLAKHKKNHETPISLTECILPQMARIRVKASSKKHYKENLSHVVTEEELKWGFFLLGEVMQAPSHIIVISDISGRTISMLHTDDFELIPTQSC